MSLHHFSFSLPQYLLALLAIPLFFAFTLVARRRQSRYTVAFTNLGLVAAITARRRSRWRRRVPLILLALALAASAAALARPRIQLTAADQSATIILLVDVSGSMAAPDVEPTRIQAAITAMHDFIDVLPTNDKVGLLTFSDKVQILNRPTTDRSAVAGGLDVLSPEGGTALGIGVKEAVKTAVSTMAAEGVYHTPGTFLPAAIVLESDGAQDRGTVTTFAAAQLAKAAGVRIYGVALGTRHGYIREGTGFARVKIPVPPDPGTVALLARESGGQAFSATNAASLNTIYRNLGSSIGRHDEPTDITSWFALAAAILLVAGVGTARAWGAALP